MAAICNVSLLNLVELHLARLAVEMLQDSVGPTPRSGQGEQNMKCLEFIY